MAEQNRKITIEKVKRVECFEKGMTSILIVLSNGEKRMVIKGYFPEKYDSSSFADKAQQENGVSYEGTNLTLDEALAYTNGAIKKLFEN